MGTSTGPPWPTCPGGMRGFPIRPHLTSLAAMRRGPKVRISRALGIALTPKAGRIMERRPNPPGQHGASQRRKVSEYKKQLLEKQRLRAQYNVSERQLRKTFEE